MASFFGWKEISDVGKQPSLEKKGRKKRNGMNDWICGLTSMLMNEPVKRLPVTLYKRYNHKSFCIEKNSMCGKSRTAKR